MRRILALLRTSVGRKVLMAVTGFLLIGFLAALACGLVALALLRRAVLAGRLHWFAAWCLPVGAFVLWTERASLWG